MNKCNAHLMEKNNIKLFICTSTESVLSISI
jgi:hypothetical protein